ncbi:MAG: hypothetical protein II194_08660, partial [Bacteroidales bacterium]|nr:hypothetical protein [Bacteroidales bacterium]
MRIESITSAQNPKIKDLLALQEKSKERRKKGLFVVEGRRELLHCVETGYEPYTVFICPEIYAAPEVADRCTMGSSCLIEARKTDHPCTFIPPEWAYSYPDDESMYLKNHDIIGTGVNFWWIELGGEMDTIADAQTINEELI